MNRDELQQLSKDELIEFCLKLQSNSSRPRKTSRTSSLPPSTDKKAKRANAKPGGAKPGHAPHFRAPSDSPEKIIDHRPEACSGCGAAFDEHSPSKVVSQSDFIDIPPIQPFTEQHRRLACTCSHCGEQTKAPLPDVAKGSPFGPGIASLALYLKSFQFCSYQRLQSLFQDVFGLKISQGGIMNLLKRSSQAFTQKYDVIVERLRGARAVACDETGMRIEGCNGQQWVFIAKDAVVHCADFTRKAEVIDTMMAGHVPEFWLSDRYAGQQNKGKQHQTCLAHLARDVARVLEVGDEKLGLSLKLWLGDVFGLAGRIRELAQSTIKAKVRKMEQRIDQILSWQGTCVETAKVVRKFRKARDQLLVFVKAPDLVQATNNDCERHLRTPVIMRKVTNGFRAKWAADADCKVRTVIDTAKLAGKSPHQTIYAILAA